MIGLNDLLSIITTMEQNIKGQINLEDLAGLSSQVIDQCQQSLPEVDQHIAEIS
jgi:transcriptional regulator GlxA family with amidase domain